MPFNLNAFYYSRKNSEEDESAIKKLNSSWNVQSDSAMNPEISIFVSSNYCFLMGRRASYI